MKVFPERTSQPIRSIRCLGIRCLWQWSPQLSALAGTAAVIAIVINGSLGVGDSIRHRLRQMANQRLGGIVATIVATILSLIHI